MGIIEVHTDEEMHKIEKLAREIIPEFYAPYIPHDHNIFFIEKFQTAKAIKTQINQGFKYYLLQNDNSGIGYLGIHVKGKVLLLSKLYILKKWRGRGFGQKSDDPGRYIIP